MKEGKLLLGVTGTSSSQVASMLKEKTLFLHKQDQALLGKDFRDHLMESLKVKKQSIEAIAEDYCRIFIRKSQLRGRLGILAPERFLRMETVPSSFQQNMLNIGEETRN